MADLESSPMRRWLVLGFALLVGLPAILLFRWGASGSPDLEGVTPLTVARRPNVIVYLVDTLRADHLGLYGYYRDTSPVLDKWASEGVVFDRAYAPCSWTKPSVVSLMSGLDPVSHGVEDRLDQIPPGVLMLSERLKASGYSTFAAVTNPNVLPHWGFDRGFDVYDDLDSAGHGTRADTVSDYVEQKLGDFAQSEPFFLYLHLIDPHAPYEPPAPFDTLFPKTPALPPKMSIGQYDGEVAFVDFQFERVLDSLKAHGLEENTMMIFLADHGEELLDHGHFGHGGTLFEEAVRIPLVIRFPRGEHAGTRVQARASLIDVVPTVMSVLGQPPPTEVDGRDLTELLKGNEPPWANRELFLSLRTTGPDSHLVRGVLGGSHKYLRRSRPTASESLFNLERDPDETEDLVAEQADTRLGLAVKLDAYLGAKSSGIHLRILSDLGSDPVGCEALLRTTGRFVDVSGIRLEAGDRLDLSDGGRTLHLECQLENRFQSLLDGPRLVPDEDGLVFLVSPPGAPITVQRLHSDGRALPLRAGASRRLEEVPFKFEATDATWSIRDVGELLGDAGSARGREAAGAYLGVIRAPVEPGKVMQEILDRLRSLGYVGGTN